MEDTIIQRAQMGDQLAFQQLIEAYNAVAWRTAHVLLPNRAHVEDVMQEVLCTTYHTGATLLENEPGGRTLPPKMMSHQ